jgi:DNA-directed RNA polymerase specialized sigma24 family protein
VPRGIYHGTGGSDRLLARSALAACGARLTGEPALANDALQESLVAISLGIQSLDDPARFSGWVYRIVGIKAADCIRQRQRTPVGESKSSELQPD